MAIPVSGSRLIEIAGKSCRWAMSRQPTDGVINVIVQGTGGALTIKLAQEVEGMVWLLNKNGESHVGPITPNWVKELAAQAIDKGWRPTGSESYKFTIAGKSMERI